MYYDSDTFLVEMLLFFIIFMVIALVITRRQAAAKKKIAQAAKPANQVKPDAGEAGKIVEDVKMTQTSRIVDAVQVLDELGEASKGYRHYCELVGTSQDTGGVTAPYCKREVAYYDLRCYRIEVRMGDDVETLVAHERSFDPFYFTDASGDQRIYVDLESFGKNCILVNATNRVEGPNSDFSKKFSSAIGAASSRNATGMPGVMAAARQASERMGNVVDEAAQRMAERAILVGAMLNQAVSGGWVAAPAYAGAAMPFASPAPHASEPRNVRFDRDHHRSYGRPPMGMGGISFGPSGYPRDLDIFLGGVGRGRLGGPRYRKNDDLEDAVETLVGMGVGALIGSLASASRPTASTGRPDPTDVGSLNSFRGYRIIEDVVPLRSPIYALGEIHRNGTDVYIGKSVSESYPSSYFATKPEAEVIAHLSS